MKKIKKLADLKNLDKSHLINQMLIGTIKGGSSAGTAATLIGPNGTKKADFGTDPVDPPGNDDIWD